VVAALVVGRWHAPGLVAADGRGGERRQRNHQGKVCHVEVPGAQHGVTRCPPGRPKQCGHLCRQVVKDGRQVEQELPGEEAVPVLDLLLLLGWRAYGLDAR